MDHYFTNKNQHFLDFSQKNKGGPYEMKEKIVKKIHGVPPYCYLEIFQIEGGASLRGGGI